MSEQESRLIAGRYANALFELATAQKAVDDVLADLQSVADLAKTNPEFADLLSSPLHSRESAANALEAILRKVKSSPLTLQFFVRLAKNRRLPLTTMIAQLFASMVEESRGEMTAEVTSAMPIGAKDQAALMTALSKSTGKKVKLSVKENTDILGGLIVKLGGKMLDASVAGRMERLRQSLKA
jgi:F-type H+-transporting ATPase subunit delta